MTPTYPSKEPLGFKHQHLFSEIAAKQTHPLSGMLFSNLFLMNIDNTTFVSEWKSKIIVSFADQDYVYSTQVPKSELIDQIKHSGIKRIEFLPEEIANSTTDLDNADYIYNIAEIINQSGKKFETFRRKIRQFSTSYPNNSLSQETDTDSIWKLQTQRLAKQDTQSPSQDLLNEHQALEKALLFYQQLSLQFLLLSHNSDLIGFAVLETVGNTVVIHFIKTNLDFKGSTEYLFLKIATQYKSTAEWINFEQDLGQEGLRQLKRSLGPAFQQIPYTLTL